jgi:hypothetical protein
MHVIMDGKIINNALNVHLVVNSKIKICLQLGVEKTRGFIVDDECP